MRRTTRWTSLLSRATDWSRRSLRRPTRSDVRGTARFTDPRLVNAWGLVFTPGGAASVAANGTGFDEVYNSRGQLLASVLLPTRQGQGHAAPTGEALNLNRGAFAGDEFVFVTEEGTIIGWLPGRRPVIRVDRDGAAVYKGADIFADDGTPRLFAANFRAGIVEVYDRNYVRMPVRGGFLIRASRPASRRST